MSDGRSTEMTINTLKADLKAVVVFAKQQPDVDPDRLILMGRSQGGLVTGLVVKEIRDQVAGQIQFFPGYNIPDYVRGGWLMQDFDPINIPEEFPAGPLVLSRQYDEVMMKLHPWDELLPYEGPVLLVHGTADTLVPVETSKKAYEIYTEGHPELHPEKKLVTIEGAVHGFSGEYDRIAIAAMREFIILTSLAGYVNRADTGCFSCERTPILSKGWDLFFQLLTGGRACFSGVHGPERKYGGE